jgi:hypothetical protein
MIRGKWRTITVTLVAAVAALTFAACDVNKSSPEEDDAALWANIIWTGQFANSRPDSVVKMTLSVTEIDPGSGCAAPNKYAPNFKEAFVTYSWDQVPWRGGDPNKGYDGILGNFFVWDDTAKAYKGGTYEWWEVWAGARHAMINAQDGFNNIKMPCSGTKVAFAWTNFKGTERSNLVQTVWP